MSWIQSAAGSPLDLAASRVTQPDPAMLLVASQRTSTVWVLAAIFFFVALFGYVQIYRARGLTAWTLLSPVFTIIAVVFSFGAHQKEFHRGQNTAKVAARLGPMAFEQTLPLPPQGKIVISVRRERSSSTKPAIATTTRWYDIAVAGQPALGFTIAGDRDAARAFAKTLAATLKYALQDDAEDDGVERQP